MTHVSYSQISTFRQCPLKWQLQSVDRLTLPPDREKPALRTGSLFHKMLEARYREFQAQDNSGVPRDQITARAEAYLALEREGVTADETVDRLVWMYAGYDKAYGTDEAWEILEVEYTIDVPFYKGVRFTGRIDLIVRERANGRIWVVDFKTGGGKDASGGAWSRELDLEDQFALYQRAGDDKVPVKDRLEVFGTIYGLIRTDQLKREMALEERFGRYRMFRSEEALDAVWADAVLTARAMGVARNRRIRDLPLYSSPDPQQCRWKCSFVDAHLLARASGRDVAEIARDNGFVDRDDDPAPVEAATA